MNNFCVYKHTSPSGKVYIGITSQKPERRWRSDGSGYRHNKKMMNAIRKYGWSNFEHEILLEGLTEEEALKIEKELIQKYDSYKNGYNSSLGGDYGGYTDDVKESISKSVKKLWQDEEYRQHMSNVHKGQRNFGYKHTDETKKKMSEIVKKRCEDEEYRKKLSQSAKKRAKKMGSEYYSKKAKAVWENEESRRKIIESKKGNRYRAKKVICVETNVIYLSVKDAAKAMGCSREAIGSCCRGTSKKSCGLHWRFADE